MDNLPVDVLAIIFVKNGARSLFQKLYLVCTKFKNMFTLIEGSHRLKPIVLFDALDIAESFKSSNMSFVRFHFENSIEDHSYEALSLVAAQTSHKLFDFVIEFKWKLCSVAFFVIGTSGDVEYMRSIYKIIDCSTRAVDEMIRSQFVLGARYSIGLNLSQDEYFNVFRAFGHIPVVIPIPN
jgi:hypothetical protein